MDNHTNRHFERPTTNRPPVLFNITILALLVGFVAGFGGYLVARLILPIDSINYLNLSNGQREIKINIEQPLTSLANKYQKSVAGIYRPVQTNTLIGQPLFTEADFIGSAVVVTSDGWLMTTDQVTKNTQVTVVLGDKVYTPQEIKTDVFTRAVFIKIEESSLQPVNFQLTDNLEIGEKVFTNMDQANSLNHSFYTALLNNNHYEISKYLYSDELDYYLQISSDNLANFGDPYFNLEGALLGLSYQLEDETLLIPAEYLKQAVKHLLNGTARPVLGVRYVDMENNSGFMRRGNLIYHPTLPVVDYQSPAAAVKLKVGDQIVAVNNDLISATHTLTSIIQNYRQGDTVVIKILRDEIEQDLAIQL